MELRQISLQMWRRSWQSPKIHPFTPINRKSLNRRAGVKPLKKTRQPDSRLLRRMQQIEKLESSKKRHVLQMLDTLIEHAQLTQQTTEESNPHANA
jgi:hypothetical protein